MAGDMTSRERVLAAYAGQEPDRVPIVFRTVRPLEGRWRNRVERAEVLLGMGVDDVLPVGLPTVHGPHVTASVWKEAAEPYPVLHKRWETPAGTLHASVQLTDDWQPKDVPLYADQSWSRGVEFLVKGPEDLDALDAILADPRQGDLAAWRERVRETRAAADRLGVVLQGNMWPAPLYAKGFIGPMRAILAVREEPELLDEVLRRVHRWTRQGLELLLDAGVDVVYRSGCYETVDFFAPEDVRRFFMPILKADVELCHQAGVPLHSFAQTGVAPFIEDYVEMGVDVLSALDTRGANPLDLADVKRRVDGRCCLMGGVDNRTPFTDGSPEQMERTVLDVLRILAPGGGYILSTSGTLFPETVEANVMAFIEAGLKWGRYPLELAD